MNAATAQPTSGTGDTLAVSEIDASCRVPLFVLFVSAVVWLVIASLFTLIASIKFHAPDFLADCRLLTYGRVHEAAITAQLYGFALQAGFGVALWVFARSGRNRVLQPWVIAIGGKLWNLAVLVGVIAILAGDSTGYENFQMPHYATAMLFLGFLVIAIWTLLTLHRRTERPMNVSQWYLLAGFFWFAWIFSTAAFLLLGSPVRGVTQAIIAWWYSDNLMLVWMSLTGLATVFFFIDESSEKLRENYYLALFAFWTLILFGGWTGIPTSAPVPAWLPAMSTSAAALLAIPLITILLIVSRLRLNGSGVAVQDASIRFVRFAMAAWLLALSLKIVGALPGASSALEFTWFNVAQSQLNSYGFFAMGMFGAIYYIVPRVTGLEWPSRKAARAHFWLSAIGILLIVMPLAIGGVIQGSQLNNGQIAFMDLTRTSLHFLRISTIGDLLILIGNLLLALNLVALSVRHCRAHFLPAYESVTTELKPAEVKQ